MDGASEKKKRLMNVMLDFERKVRNLVLLQLLKLKIRISDYLKKWVSWFSGKFCLDSKNSKFQKQHSQGGKSYNVLKLFSNRGMSIAISVMCLGRFVFNSIYTVCKMMNYRYIALKKCEEMCNNRFVHYRFSTILPSTAKLRNFSGFSRLW